MQSLKKIFIPYLKYLVPVPVLKVLNYLILFILISFINGNFCLSQEFSLK